MTLTAAQKRKIRKDKLQDFNPDRPDKDGGIFNLPFDIEESELIILPVPWDVTAKYEGTSDAPKNIYESSKKCSLYNELYDCAWEAGVAMHNIPQKWHESSKELWKLRHKLSKINKLNKTKKRETEALQYTKQINYSNLLLKEWIEDKCNYYLEEKKLVGLLGGDKSTMTGYVTALAKKHTNFGVLYLDAHAGLKDKTNGFDYSHDSAVKNLIDIKEINSIILCGTRKQNFEEVNNLNSNTFIRQYSDQYLNDKLFKGTTWRTMVNEMISALPAKVYISLDIDILPQYLCPDAPTAEPGGFRFEEILAIISEIQRVGKKIIGFDLTGVGSAGKKQPDWNAEVGAKVLLHLVSHTLLSHRKS